jgi:hypothetical protein
MQHLLTLGMDSKEDAFCPVYGRHKIRQLQAHYEYCQGHGASKGGEPLTFKTERKNTAMTIDKITTLGAFIDKVHDVRANLWRVAEDSFWH